MINTTFTLTTACFKLNNDGRSLDEVLEATNSLMAISVYLVIYGDKETIPILRQKREQYGNGHCTKYIELEKNDMWSFKYLDMVKQNREKYWPTRDERTSAESHLIVCNKADFILQTIESNPFNTTHFGWIDAFLGKDTVRICKKYHIHFLPNLLNQVTDDKFHIQVLNVYDKKFKLPENKRDYFSKYKFVVSGGFFVCGARTGKLILPRVKELFVQTTEMGYGHGEEMLFFEILDEFPDDIVRGYGDYNEIMNNILCPTVNVHYIYWVPLRGYINFGYYNEAFDCCNAVLKSFLIRSNYNITEDTCKSFDVEKQIFLYIVEDYKNAASHYKPELMNYYDKFLNF